MKSFCRPDTCTKAPSPTCPGAFKPGAPKSWTPEEWKHWIKVDLHNEEVEWNMELSDYYNDRPSFITPAHQKPEDLKERKHKARLARRRAHYHSVRAHELAREGFIQFGYPQMLQEHYP